MSTQTRDRVFVSGGASTGILLEIGYYSQIYWAWRVRIS